ncbi:MAG: hypothetical protein KDA60_18230 [Planctomycetales bacterium]|nr:hypothetical protein [Planctomycetales bacterium]
MYMTRGVVYLLTSNQLAARLVVSVYSLRRWYSGPICLFSTRPESHELGEICAHDPRLAVEHRTIPERPGRGHTSAYLTKTATMLKSPYDQSLFLDADTLVAGDIRPLFDSLEEGEVTATAFCEGLTTDAHFQEQLEKWRTLGDPAHLAFRVPSLIWGVSHFSYPAINVGVFAVRRDAAILPHWDALTLAAHNMPLPEEIALQLLLPEFDHSILAMKYNCHPMAYRGGDDVRIWHFAGATHLDHDPSRALWLPAYDECRQHNIARICEWSRITSPS